MAIIRYPGSKAKLAEQIWKYFPTSQQLPLWSAADRTEYREPFFGSGEFGLRVMRSVLDHRCKVWVNDVDPGIAALWRAVREMPEKLCNLVHNFKPSVDSFYEFKQYDGDISEDFVSDGFRKLALHRMSVSGFGAMSGGPIGGRHQSSEKYTVGCRWTPSRIKREVAHVSRMMKQFVDLRITCGDFRELVETAPENCFIYLDPPYYEKGGQLYKYNMSREDHEDLATRLKATKAKWVLSYDDHPEIRRLYSWARIEPIFATYTNAVCRDGKRPKNQEIVILPS